MNQPAGRDVPTSARKRRVTPETMAEAGIALTLPNVTVKSIAESLGVSIVAIYNNIDDLRSLKALVAEEILRRWSPPLPGAEVSMHDALLTLSSALRELIRQNPGIAEYLIGLTPSSIDSARMIDNVQARYRRSYDLTPKQATWAVVNVCEHAVALSELVYKVPPGPSAQGPDQMYRWSMRTVIVGTLELIFEPDFEQA